MTRIGYAAGVVAATVAVGAAIATAMAGATATRRCPGTVSVTMRHTATLIATNIRPSPGLSCHRAEQTVRKYFEAKLGRPLRSCAEPATNPPYRGCRVGAFVCRVVKSPGPAQQCVADRLRIGFDERDIPLG
jgi:hypothetical protein